MSDFDYDLTPPKPTLTYAQWHNGKQQLEPLGGIAFTGGLLIEADQIKEGIPTFTRETVLLNRKKVEVFSSTDLEFALLARRRRYFTRTDEGAKYFSVAEYETAKAQGVPLRGHCQAAVILKSFPDQIFYLTFTGTADRAFTAEIKRMVEEGLPFTTQKQDGNSYTMPLHAFWLRLTPKAHEVVGQGQNKSEVTNPSLNLPDQFTREFMLSRYVGRENLARFNSLLPDLASWANAWQQNNESDLADVHESEQAAKA